ncbi:hypothetical protein Lpp126_12627, partial [Lacticaseibacillus paracasei subsp. paracasei Lpp126]
NACCLPIDDSGHGKQQAFLFNKGNISQKLRLLTIFIFWLSVVIKSEEQTKQPGR